MTYGGNEQGLPDRRTNAFAIARGGRRRAARHGHEALRKPKSASGIGQSSNRRHDETTPILTRDVVNGEAIIALMLLPGFDLYDLSALLDTFQLSNRIADRNLIVTKLVGVTSEPVACSLGIRVRPEQDINSLGSHTNVIILAGGQPAACETERFYLWIRRRLHLPGTLSAVGGGCRVLASAQALKGKVATAHRELCAALQEIHLDTRFVERLFMVDGRVATCSGRAATMDFSLHCVADIYGSAVSQTVAGRLNYDQMRKYDHERMACPTRVGVYHPKLLAAIKFMEQTLDESLSSDELADRVKLSRRQLERLFRRYLGRTPIGYCFELRLQRARLLLCQTIMSVVNVAIAAGFVSISHFSKRYRMHFGKSPRKERQSARALAYALDAAT